MSVFVSLPNDIHNFISQFMDHKTFLLLFNTCKSFKNLRQYHVLIRNKVRNCHFNSWTLSFKCNLYFNKKMLLKLSNITSFCCNTEIKDDDIKHLIHIKELNCDKNMILSDECLKNLPNLIKLTCGWNENITNEGLKYLHKLEYLDCWHNQNFTNEGIKNLKSLLVLNCGLNTNFTNEGIKNLNSLLVLSCGLNTNFTNEGVKDLNNLDIIINGDNTNFTDKINKKSNFRLEKCLIQNNTVHIIKLHGGSDMSIIGQYLNTLIKLKELDGISNHTLTCIKNLIM